MLLVLLLVFAGVLLFIVPGIFLSIAFAFYLPFILFENTSILESLKESWQLVWGYWWRVFALMAIPTGVMLAMFELIRFLGGKENVLAIVLSKILTMTLLLPFFSALVLVLYNDIRLRKGKGKIRVVE